MLSKNLKKLREHKGITQAELAKILGITQQAVARWERDKSEPDIETLKALSNYFDVSIDYLLDNKIKNQIPTFNSDERNLVYGFRNLDSSGKQLVASMIERLNFNSQPTVMRMTAI